MDATRPAPGRAQPRRLRAPEPQRRAGPGLPGRPAPAKPPRARALALRHRSPGCHTSQQTRAARIRRRQQRRAADRQGAPRRAAQALRRSGGSRRTG